MVVSENEWLEYAEAGCDGGGGGISFLLQALKVQKMWRGEAMTPFVRLGMRGALPWQIRETWGKHNR